MKVRTLESVENGGPTDLRRQISDFREAEVARILKVKRQTGGSYTDREGTSPKSLCESPVAKVQPYMQRMGPWEAYQIAVVTQLSGTKILEVKQCW